MLCLGDSYTIGEGVTPAQRWPEILAGSLRSAGLDVEGPRVIAKTGWTTFELLAAIEESGVEPPHDVVTLAVGVNDQYRGRSVKDFRTDFRRVLDRAVELSGGRPERVVVTSIPDWGLTPFAANSDRERVAEQIVAYNAAVREEVQAVGALHVDVQDLTARAARAPDGLVDDGLHYSPATHAEWAAAMEGTVRSALDG